MWLLKASSRHSMELLLCGGGIFSGGWFKRSVTCLSRCKEGPGGIGRQGGDTVGEWRI